jgi:hypothetical protein
MQLDENLNKQILQFDPAPRHQHGEDGKVTRRESVRVRASERARESGGVLSTRGGQGAARYTCITFAFRILVHWELQYIGAQEHVLSVSSFTKDVARCLASIESKVSPPALTPNVAIELEQPKTKALPDYFL